MLRNLSVAWSGKMVNDREAYTTPYAPKRDELQSPSVQKDGLAKCRHCHRFANQCIHPNQGKIVNNRFPNIIVFVLNWQPRPATISRMALGTGRWWGLIFRVAVSRPYHTELAPVAYKLEADTLASGRNDKDAPHCLVSRAGLTRQALRICAHREK